jgi:ABC-type bacteriocin/lantibiotic exporter with double-glycine peptidase domain
MPQKSQTRANIDRIISRTLAYAIVTGLLVGVYAGLVLLATHVLSVHSTVAVAAATLAAAALFNPLRRRVQHLVDRRFNRAGMTQTGSWPRSRPG